MRTQERLREINSRVAHALEHARLARQKLIYGEKTENVLTHINASIRWLEKQE